MAFECLPHTYTLSLTSEDSYSDFQRACLDQHFVLATITENCLFCESEFVHECGKVGASLRAFAHAPGNKPVTRRASEVRRRALLMQVGTMRTGAIVFVTSQI